MQFFTTILATVAVVTTVVTAAPINANSTINNNSTIVPSHAAPTTSVKLAKRSSPMCENCFSCKATQQRPVLRYTLRIGAPFANGAGCDSVKKKLTEDDSVPDITKWSCKDDKGMTKIAFTAWEYNQGWQISQAFNRAYKDIKGDGYGFNCPNY